MIYFSEKHLSIHKQEDAKCIVMEWKTFASGEKFRNGLLKGLEVLIESGYQHWLADLRKMKAIKNEDQDWSNTEWFPKALAAGVEKMAIIVSEDAFNRMAVNTIMSKVTNTNLTVQYFESQEEALKWMKQEVNEAISQ